MESRQLLHECQQDILNQIVRVMKGQPGTAGPMI